jgi:hypothetical protein
MEVSSGGHDGVEKEDEKERRKNKRMDFFFSLWL